MPNMKCCHPSRHSICFTSMSPPSERWRNVDVVSRRQSVLVYWRPLPTQRLDWPNGTAAVLSISPVYCDLRRAVRRANEVDGSNQYSALASSTACVCVCVCVFFSLTACVGLQIFSVYSERIHIKAWLILRPRMSARYRQYRRSVTHLSPHRRTDPCSQCPVFPGGHPSKYLPNSTCLNPRTAGVQSCSPSFFLHISFARRNFPLRSGLSVFQEPPKPDGMALRFRNSPTRYQITSPEVKVVWMIFWRKMW